MIDEACEGDGDLLQVNGANLSPWERLGRQLEVEGRELENGEEAMMGWVDV